MIKPEHRQLLAAASADGGLLLQRFLRSLLPFLGLVKYWWAELLASDWIPLLKYFKKNFEFFSPEF